jgi:hypothetical protein
MTRHGAQPDRSNVIPVQDALQAYADDTKSERKQSPTYKKSRLKILGAIGVASVLTIFGVAPHLKGGGDVNAASSSVAGGDKAASASANPNRSAGALSFDCELTGVRLDTADAGSDAVKMHLGVKSTGRDHVTYVASSFVEGAFDTEAPMLGDGGAGESDMVAQVPSTLFKKAVGVYALSGEGESVRCGAFMYDPSPEEPGTPQAQYASENGFPDTFER